MRRALALGGALAAAAIAARGAEFQRELSTDRPDATESPYSVEPGRWQIEVAPLRWTRDRAGGGRTETLTFGAFNAKLGLTGNSDLQFVFEPWIRVDERAGALRQTIDGHGDTTLRLKLNLAGNDGTGVATAVMPWIKLPTASDGLGNDQVEGGLIVPVALPLRGEWGLGLMAELDVVHDVEADAARLAVVTTATIAGPLAPDVGCFLELAHEAQGNDPDAWALSFNTGVTWALSSDLQLDAGANVGVTEAADDLALFVGVSARW